MYDNPEGQSTDSGGVVRAALRATLDENISLEL
jgi:hypothetical protein